MMTTTTKPRHRAQAILDYWFGSIDDRTLLNRETEPFATHFRRWYGKSAEVDAFIRQAFEPDLDEVVATGRRWDETVREWRSQPRGMLALTILLDQLPRNMYRDTARMYVQDALGLLASELARAEITDDLPLVHRMFLSVPLMHRNALLGRTSTAAEVEALKRPDAHF